MSIVRNGQASSTGARAKLRVLFDVEVIQCLYRMPSLQVLRIGLLDLHSYCLHQDFKI